MRRFFLFLRDAGRFIYALFTLLDTLLSLFIHLSLFVFTPEFKSEVRHSPI